MRQRELHRYGLLFLFLLISCVSVRAQALSAAVSNPGSQANQGFHPGWGFGARFEGSNSGDGSVYDISAGIGYNFTRHFGVDLGVPYTFIGTPSSIKQKNPGAVSGNGVGDLGADLKFLFPGQSLNYSSTIHLSAPTAGSTGKGKGLSTGHATWNWSNHIEHGWGIFTPFIAGGAGNTLPDTKYVKRLYSTFGFNAQFEAGTGVDVGPLSLSVSAYDVAPWGPQTVFSKVFRCTSGTKCSATGTSTDRKGYTTTSVQSGGASLTRDNGFNAGVEYKPVRYPYLDLEFDYSRSVPQRLNSITFGIAVDLHALMSPKTSH